MMTLRVTLCFTAVLFSQYSAVLTAGPDMKNQGENLTMVCTTEDTGPIGLYLHLRCPEKHDVFYYDISSKTLTVPPEYDGRVNISGDPKKLTVTIRSLRVNDSGVYTCVFNFFDGKRVEKETNGVLVFVKGFTTNEAMTVKVPDTETAAMPEMLVLVSALTACTVVILCMLVTAVWIIPKVKALCARRRDDRSKAHNAVYEDMRAHRAQQI